MIKIKFKNETTLFTKDIVNNILEALSAYEEDVRIIKVVPYVQPSIQIVNKMIKVLF